MKYSSDLELISILKHIYTKKTVGQSPFKANVSCLSDQNVQTDPNHTNDQSKKYIKVKRRIVNHSPETRSINQNQSRITLNRATSPFDNKSQNNNASILNFTASQQFPQMKMNNLEYTPDAYFKGNKSQIYFPHYYFPNSTMPKQYLANQSQYKANNIINLPTSHPQLYKRKKSADNIFYKSKMNNQVRYPNEFIIDPEEIIQLEDKINNIMTFVSKGKEASIPCCDWWSFYIASTLLQNQTNFFVEDSSKIIIYSASNVMMLAVTLCYDISDEEVLYSQLNLLFKTIFTLLQLNSLLLFKFIFSKLSHSDKLISEFDEYLLEKINGESKEEIDELNICNMIKHNCTSIVDLTKLILNNYVKSGIYEQLMFYFNNISKITPKELNEFFINCVYQPEKHKTRSLTARVSPNDLIDTIKINPPYLPPKEDKRPYTLILDLDETLVSFENNKDNKGMLILRPGLIEFLSIIKEYYELVLFTTAVKEYADPIANAIEKNQKFFDHRLYRNHSICVGNDRVKDLSKIGRDLSRVVIVDNLSDNYKLQRENGILIQPFYGENPSDTSLCQLTLFLIKIEKEANESSHPDLRQLLAKYHTEITTKVSSNLHLFKEKGQSNPIVLNMKHNYNQKKIELNNNNNS